jgi:hypothetical protein
MNEQEENGLTLEGLAQRLEALEGENAALRKELTEQRGSDTPRDGEEAPASEELAGQLSRRSLLSKAGAATLGAVAAGTLLNPREAEAAPCTCPPVPRHLGERHFTKVIVESPASQPKDAVVATGVIGVRGHSSTNGQAGVYGENTANKGPGVVGKGVIGVRGESRIPTQAGVYGYHATRSGPGVAGRGQWGGLFEGNLAPLLLIPGANLGKPTTGLHDKGELYLDSAGELFVCTAKGNPGTWRRVTTTPA